MAEDGVNVYACGPYVAVLRISHSVLLIVANSAQGFTLKNPEDFAKFCFEFRRANLSFGGRTKNQFVALQGIDRRKGLTCVNAMRVRPVDRLGILGRIKRKSSPDWTT